jgi:hypothetical protein
MSNARDKANIPSLNFSSTGIDDNATSTAITINSSQHVELHGGQIESNNNTSSITYSGGDNSNAGANLTLFGGSHATTPNVARFRSSATEVMRITSSGNVGIGTSSPGEKLVVERSGAGNVVRFTDGTYGVDVAVTSTGGSLQTGNINQTLDFKVYGNGYMGFYTSGTSERMRILSGGNVGIGTTTPDSLLSVNGVASFGDGTALLPSIANFGDLNTGMWFPAADTIAFSEGGAEAMRIDSSGFVGIGLTNPTAQLHVNTNSTGRSNVYFSNFNTSGGISSQEVAIGFQFNRTGGGINLSAARVVAGKEREWVGAASNQDGFLAFETCLNESVSEKMRIDSSGNVGIGTTSPSDTANRVTLELNDTWGGRIRNSSGGTANSEWSISTSNMALFGTIVSQPLAFTTNNLERMRIDSSGNVGIGTSSPTQKLEVSGTGNTIIKSKATTNNVLGGFEAHNNTGTSYLKVFQLGSAYGGTTFGGVTGNDQAVIEAQAVSSLAFTTQGGTPDIIFAPARTARMTIKNGGNVGINTTSPESGSLLTISHPGDSKYGLNLDSSVTSGTQYHLQFKRGGTQAGYITSNSATTIAFNNASDERLKENIQNSNSAIQDLKDIQVRQFDWKDNIDTHRDFGFVAQELVNVVPEAVTQGTDELDDNGKPVRSWGVDYSHIVPRLVKVCQEQQTKIEELEARITTLEANNP